MNRMPKPGEIYKHFKNKLYQIVTVAIHTETGEKMVVYQALYGDFKTYVRPLDMFLSKVDKEKYKDVSCEYRFELVDMTEKEDMYISENKEVAKEEKSSEKEEVKAKEEREESINPILLEFLEGNSYEEKIDTINKNKKKITDHLLNDMAASLDITVEEGELDGRIGSFLFCLTTLARFEGNRLR